MLHRYLVSKNFTVRNPISDEIQVETCPSSVILGGSKCNDGSAELCGRYVNKDVITHDGLTYPVYEKENGLYWIYWNKFNYWYINHNLGMGSNEKNLRTNYITVYLITSERTRYFYKK